MLKLLTIDIETAPATAYVWGIHKQHLNVGQIATPTVMLCFAAKWKHQKRVIYRSLHHDGLDAMLAELWDLLDQADAVIHYNGTSFDIPHINREFLLANLGPPSPYAQIDLYKTVRSQFKFLSNKLDSISQALEIGTKVAHEGLGLWVACLDGDDSAWGRMRRYNIGDVRLTEDLYDELLPWIKNHPSVNLVTGVEHSCPKCGSESLQKRGFHYTRVSAFQRYRCNDCGSYSHNGKRLEGVDLRGM